MTQLVYGFIEGDKDQKDLLGGKGANLAEMTRLGLPVPPGFTITTEACRSYLVAGTEPGELRVQVTMALRRLEDDLGRRLGDRHEPLLVSVRSGAKFSMPGMMETVLNIGLNDASVKGLAESSGDARFAWDSYRRLLQMFGKTVLGMDGAVFSAALDRVKTNRGHASDVDLTVADLQDLVEEFKAAVKAHSGTEFPQHPREQLDQAIRAVFDSWNTPRARIYRRRERIPEDAGTAVNICTMVFGNMGDSSGTGVAFTPGPGVGAAWGVRRLSRQRAGRGRGRGHPEHSRTSRSGGARSRVRPRAGPSDASAGDPLPRSVRHRVHDRTREALDASDPHRKAHRRGGVPDCDPAGRRGTDHSRRGPDPGVGCGTRTADVPAVRQGQHAVAARARDGRLTWRGGRDGGLRFRGSGSGCAAGGVGDPGPEGDESRRSGGDDRGSGDPHGSRRKDISCGGRRARDGPDVCVRRRSPGRGARIADRAGR